MALVVVDTNDHVLDEAREAVARMWYTVEHTSDIRRADANDTIHFVHEEASEVTKVAMKLGLLGRHDYVRSARVQATEYSIADLIAEVGDVLLMALTLAQAFDLDPGVCLNESLNKFYARAAETLRVRDAKKGSP